MRLEFTIIIENDEWDEEEYDEKSERTVVLENSDLINMIEQRIILEENEYVDSIWIVKEQK